MKASPPIPAFIGLALLLAAFSAGAQIVPDGATNTLSNVTNTITGDVTVGTNGSLTLLILTNNALLTNSANGVIGRNTGANSNSAGLTGANSRWLVLNDAFVGSNGLFSLLVLGNGALVGNNNCILGGTSTGGAYQVIGIVGQPDASGPLAINRPPFAFLDHSTEI